MTNNSMGIEQAFEIAVETAKSLWQAGGEDKDVTTGVAKKLLQMGATPKIIIKALKSIPTLDISGLWEINFGLPKATTCRVKGCWTGSCPGFLC